MKEHPIGRYQSHFAGRAGAWIAYFLAVGFFLFEFIVRVEPSLDNQGIARWFGASEGRFGLIASLFFWVYAPMQLLVGLALDRYGARRLIVPAILVCALGPLIMAASDNQLVGAAGRMITGLGASFGFVGALYVANHRFLPKYFALLSGAVGAVGMLGTAIGVVFLTQLVEKTGWREVFFATSAAGLTLFVLAALLLFDDGQKYTRKNRESHPLMPLQPLLRSRRIWLIAVLGALYYVPVNVYGGLWGKAQIMADQGLDPVSAEFAVSLLFWGLAAGSALAGALSDLLAHRKWLLFGGALVSAGLYAAVLFSNNLGLTQLSVLLFLAGLFGGPQILTFAMAKEGMPGAVAGTTIALVNMIGIGAALIFQPLVSYLIELNGGAFTLAMAVLPACLLGAALITLFVREERHPDHQTGNKRAP